MLSMNDIVLHAKTSKGAAVGTIKYDDVVKTYQAICEHSLPEVASAAAAT
jgi:hypothetical protein